MIWQKRMGTARECRKEGGSPSINNGFVARSEYRRRKPGGRDRKKEGENPKPSGINSEKSRARYVAKGSVEGRRQGGKGKKSRKYGVEDRGST